MLDSILKNLGNLDDLSTRLGLPPQQVQSMVEGLKAKAASGDLNLSSLLEMAQSNGISMDKIQEIMGGAGGLAGMQGKLGGFLDKDGDGNPLNDLGRLTKGFFG